MKNTKYFFMTRRIGSTLYRVKIYLAEKGTETMGDKIFRVISNHPLANDKRCGIMDLPQMSRSA